jgi:hypothetical protein
MDRWCLPASTADAMAHSGFMADLRRLLPHNSWPLSRNLGLLCRNAESAPDKTTFDAPCIARLLTAARAPVVVLGALPDRMKVF